MQVVTELKNRGVKDILIACIDGLKGFEEAIKAIYPKTQIQGCIVHQTRNSLKYVTWKERKEVADDLKNIYRAATEELAETELSKFEEKWDKKYPMIGKSWRRNWEKLSTYFIYPEDIRRATYTTNAIESLNMSIRKVTKNRSSSPNDESMIKLIYMALKNIVKKWTMPIQNWKAALQCLAVHFGDRIPMN